MSFWNSIRHLFCAGAHDDDDAAYFYADDRDDDGDARTGKSRGRGDEDRLPSHHIPFPKY